MLQNGPGRRQLAVWVNSPLILFNTTKAICVSNKLVIVYTQGASAFTKWGKRNSVRKND